MTFTDRLLHEVKLRRTGVEHCVKVLEVGKFTAEDITDMFLPNQNEHVKALKLELICIKIYHIRISQHTT